MDIKKAYQELVWTSIILNFFDALLTAFVIMALSYFLLYFIRFNFSIAIVIAVLFFARSFYNKIKQNKMLLLENKYPNLKERLRTSYDNQDTQNTVANSLHQDIMRLLDKVDVNAYLVIRKIAFKVIAICILLFLVLYFSSVGFDILELKTRVVQSAAYQRLSGTVRDLFDQPGEMKDRPKLSEPRLLDLGDKEMNVSIDTYNTKLDTSALEDSEKNDYGGYYPDEIKGAAQEAYKEDIPEEYKDVIKDYFEKINK